MKTIGHRGDDVRELVDDIFGLDVDHPHPGVGMLVFDDEPKRRIELVGTFEASGRPAHAAFESLPLVSGECRKQVLFGSEPTEKSWPGHPGLNSDIGQAELPLAVAAEYLGGVSKNSLLRRGFALEGRRRFHKPNFTK